MYENGWDMETKELYREILNEHNLNPSHKKDLGDGALRLNGVNPSCGDDITLTLKIGDDKIITDGAFTGSGCAVSQASADMMLDLIIGKTTDEALRLGAIFIKMIQGEAAPADLEELDEAAALQDIARMPARVKCAVLGWRTMKEMLETSQINKRSASAHCGV